MVALKNDEDDIPAILRNIRRKRVAYKKEYVEMLIKHMQQGYSFQSFAGVVGVPSSVLNIWADNFPEFNAAKEIGDSRSLLFWEKVGIEGMTGNIDGFGAGVWAFNMKNRFDWSDKTEKPVEDRKPIRLAYDPTLRLTGETNGSGHSTTSGREERREQDGVIEAETKG